MKRIAYLLSLVAISAFATFGGDPLPLNKGGSNATSADAALSSLGALAKAGDTVSGDLQFSGSRTIKASTTDGSDNQTFNVNGGGAASVNRGGGATFYGNEATPAGDLDLFAGNVSGGSLNFYTGAFSLRGQLSSAGAWTFGESGGTQAHTANGSLTATSDIQAGVASTSSGALVSCNSGTANCFSASRVGVSESRLVSQGSSAMTFYTNNNERVSITSGGIVNIAAATASTSKDTGALVVTDGGLGVEGSVFAGGTISASGGTMTGNLQVGSLTAVTSMVLAGNFGTSNPVRVGGTLFTQLTSVTVANTSSETSALTMTGALGSVTVLANAMTQGRSFYFKAGGIMRCTGTPTATMRFKVGSSNVIAQNLTPGAIDTGGDTESYCDTTAKPFIIDAWCSFRAVGASGSLMCNGGSAQIYANSKAGGISNFGSVSTATIDTTANQALDFTIQWDAASADNELTIHNAIIEVK